VEGSGCRFGRGFLLGERLDWVGERVDWVWRFDFWGWRFLSGMSNFSKVHVLGFVCSWDFDVVLLITCSFVLTLFFFSDRQSADIGLCNFLI